MPVKSQPKKKRWIVIGRHDGVASPSYAKCSDTYEEAMDHAGAFWNLYEGDYDAKRRPRFTAGEGYDPKDVEIVYERGKIASVIFANGQGPCIDILRES